MADFVEICNVCARKAIIEAAKRIINSDKVCHSYSDLNFGVTFFGTQCIINISAHFVSFIFYFSSWCHVLDVIAVGDHVGIRVQRLLSSIALLSANYTATNGGVTTPAHFQCWPRALSRPDGMELSTGRPPHPAGLCLLQTGLKFTRIAYSPCSSVNGSLETFVTSALYKSTVASVSSVSPGAAFDGVTCFFPLKN